MNDFTMIFEGIITILIAVITIFVIPWLKSKVSSEDMAEIMKWVKIAVQAAEMIYKESGMGRAKKNYVINFLNQMNITYDEEKIDALIESAVLELKKGCLDESN